MKPMKKTGLLATVASVALALSACGGGPGANSEPTVESAPSFEAGTTMAKLSEAGSITIGTKFDQPLFGQKGPNNKPVGFDVEIGELIAAKLGISPDNVKW